MGTSRLMRKAVSVSSVNICKLYLTATTSPQYADVNLYPMGDGIFIVADDLESLQSLLRDIFSSLAGAQIRKYNQDELEEPYVSVIKGTVTRGEVIEGRGITETELANHDFKKFLIFGKPVVTGHGIEDRAPPFGIYLYDVHRNGEKDLWKWWENQELIDLLRGLLENYYDFHLENPGYGYPEEKIKQHRQEARAYLQT